MLYTPRPEKKFLYRGTPEKPKKPKKPALEIIWQKTLLRHKLIFLYYVRGTFFYRMVQTEQTNFFDFPVNSAKNGGKMGFLGD